MALGLRFFWLLAGSLSCVTCAAGSGGSVAAPARDEPRTRLATRPVKPTREAEQAPRLFPPLEGSTSNAAGEERDGSQRIVSYGLRVLARPDGALELAREYLPVARQVSALELPARLGGGFLFSVVSSSTTLFFRSPTFTGTLEPFARLDFEADQVVAGFDRLYVLSRRPERLVALDVETGKSIGLGSLPVSPGYGRLAFVDAWFGAVQLPFRGIVASFDAGASWHALGPGFTSIEGSDGAVRLSGPNGVFELDRAGALTRRDAPAPPRENAVAQALRGSDNRDARATRDRLGRDALKLAVLRGFRDGDGNFVVADAGGLLRVRPSDGKLLDRDEHAYPGGGECNALPYGRGFAFACTDGPNQTALYEFVPPLALRRVQQFDGARYVASSGNGTLIIRGACRGAPAVGGAYCIAGSDGALREIQVRGDSGVERVLALADGRVAVIVPPRLGAPGFLSLIDARGKEQRLKLKLPAAAPGASLLEKGLWLDGFVETQPGVLSGWVVGSEPFVGVRVALDGTVAVGHPEGSVDRALLSGSHALVVGRTGRARESTDGGFDWSDVELPSEFDAGRELRGDARLQGCSELGCAFAGFVRVGWRTGSAAPRLRIASIPDSTPLVQPGGSRWRLLCEATGEVSEPALPNRPRSSRADESNSAPWASFYESAAPVLSTSEVGFDASGNDDQPQFHAYAWGERGADWARGGHLQLRLLDRYQVRRGVLQSATTRSPWPDATTAAESFGFDGTGNQSSWRAYPDPGARGAAVLSTARGTTDLLLFEEGKTVARVANAGRLGFGLLSSAAKLNDAWYTAAFIDNRALALSRIAAGRVERLAEYPDAQRDAGSVSLVRGQRGEELGVWVVGRGWYLFPIDPSTRQLGSPLYRSAQDLATIPPVCEADADGYLLAGALSLEPSLRFTRSTDELSARRIEGQFIWSARGLCTRALAADTDNVPPRSPTAAKAATGAVPEAPKATLSLPLTVTERRPSGRRWAYVCSP